MSFYALFVTIGLVTLAVTLVSLRREHIRTEYSVSWLLVGLVLTILALGRSELQAAARYLGVDPSVCLLLVAGGLVSGLVFEMSHVVSRLRDENVTLAQRLAILEFKLHQREPESRP